MSEPKFTKGPWTADLTNTEEYIAVDPYIYIKREYQYACSVEEENANALLIAAAPEMYSLLEELATCDAIPNSYYIRKILKTLAKARGEE